MDVKKQYAYTTQEKIQIILKHILFCLRGVLWLGVGYAAILLFEYLNRNGHPFIGVLLALAGIIYSIWLVFWQVIQDIKFVRRKYAWHLYSKVYEEIRQEAPTVSPLLGITPYGPVSKEILWDNMNGVYDGFPSYMNHFLHRKDSNAQMMRGTLSSVEMRAIMLRTHNMVHSVRIWHDAGIISFNYEKPIKIVDILAVSLNNDPTFVRGQAVTKTVTRHSGHSYPGFFGQRYYQGKSVHETRTTYEPNRVYNNFTLFVTTRNIDNPVIRIEIGQDSELAHMLQSELLCLIEVNRTHQQTNL